MSVPQIDSRICEFSHSNCVIKIEVINNVREFPETVPTIDLPPAVMTMADAILKMRNGFLLRRACWKPKKSINLMNGTSWFFRQDGRRYTPTADDIVADDWQFV